MGMVLNVEDCFYRNVDKQPHPLAFHIVLVDPFGVDIASLETKRDTERERERE